MQRTTRAGVGHRLLTLAVCVAGLLAALPLGAAAAPADCEPPIVVHTPTGSQGDEAAVAIDSQVIVDGGAAWERVSWTASDGTEVAAVEVVSPDGEVETRTTDARQGLAEDVAELRFCAPASDETEEEAREPTTPAEEGPDQAQTDDAPADDDPSGSTSSDQATDASATGSDGSSKPDPATGAESDATAGEDPEAPAGSSGSGDAAGDTEAAGDADARDAESAATQAGDQQAPAQAAGTETQPSSTGPALVALLLLVVTAPLVALGWHRRAAR